MEFYKHLTHNHVSARYYTTAYKTSSGFLSLTVDLLAHYPAIQDWLPAEEPKPGENFCGADRSTDPQRLAGHRVDNSADPIIVGLEKAALLLMREGYAPDMLLVSTKRLSDLMNHATYPFTGRAAFVSLPCGQVNIIEEPSLPDDASYLVSSSTWTSVGYVPSSTPAYGRDVLICNNPGANCRINHGAPQAAQPMQGLMAAINAATTPTGLAAWVPSPVTLQDEINRVTAKVLQTPKCECGSEVVGSPRHSSWCPKSQS